VLLSSAEFFHEIEEHRDEEDGDEAGGEHAADDGEAHALHFEKRRAPLQHIGFVHQPVAPPGPRGGFIRAPRHAQSGQRHQQGHAGLDPFLPG